MQAEEIREMSEEDMHARLAELEEERFRLRFRGATETLEDPLRIRAIRKEVARVKTVLRQRELEKQAESGAARKRGSRAKRAAR